MLFRSTRLFGQVVLHVPGCGFAVALKPLKELVFVSPMHHVPRTTIAIIMEGRCAWGQMNPKKCAQRLDAQRLDRQLFQTLQTIAKGGLLSVISQLPHYACYTSGIIAMWQHHQLSSAFSNTQAACHDRHARAAISWRRQQVEVGPHCESR